MVLLKAAMVIPVLATSFMFMQEGPGESAASSGDPNLRKGRRASIARLEAQARHEVDQLSLLEQQVLSRRLRVERILLALDHVTDVAIQMHPERVAALEPVITNLAEQTLELNSAEAMLDHETDGRLDEIEDDVSGLVRAVDLYIEPEMTL